MDCVKIMQKTTFQSIETSMYIYKYKAIVHDCVGGPLVEIRVCFNGKVATVGRYIIQGIW